MIQPYASERGVKEYRGKKRYKVNLPEQLVECEVNYQRLCRLLANIQTLAIGYQREFIIGLHNGLESIMSLTVLEQTKYTSVVHIVQNLSLQKRNTSIKSTPEENNAGVLNLCNKTRQTVYKGDIRLYHDADMAEVVKCQRYRHFKPRYEYPNLNMHQVDEKAQMNRFLGELLAHCLSHGRVSEKLYPRCEQGQ